jgi:hypothetical protein
VAGTPETFAIGSGRQTRSCDRREHPARPAIPAAPVRNLARLSREREPPLVRSPVRAVILSVEDRPAGCLDGPAPENWWQALAIPCEDQESCA